METQPSADAARARFAAATDEHLTAPLADGIEIRHVTRAEAVATADRLWDDDPRPPARMAAVYSRDEAARLADLAAASGEPLAHQLRFVRDGEEVGCYVGFQESFGRYYMAISILHRELRGRGLYKAMLGRVVAAVRDAGFAEIYSRHRVDNNAVLVPKLKAGFTIAAFEITPRYGTLVHLRRYLVPGLEELYENRVDGAHAESLRARGILR